jgi:hypothetical protein
MNTTTKKLGTLIAAGFLMGGVAQAAILDVTFGTENDGSGDFTQEVETANLTWSDTADSLQLSRVVEPGLNNSSALTQLTLDRSVGNEYQFTMVFSWDEGYAGNNNRFGLQMFADDSAAALSTEGIAAFWNIANNTWYVGGGVNVFDYSTAKLGEAKTGTPFSGETQEYTIDGTVAFLAGDVLFAEFSIIDPDNTTTTIGGNFVASEMTGDWFGLVGRNRTTGGALEINAKSFNATQTAIPEPSTLALLGIALGSAFFFRRRK